MFRSVTATPAEIAAPRPGDDIVDPAEVIMDRAFTLDAAPATVWPWLVQLGKGRAGWYLPRTVERLIPPSHRAARVLDPRWQDLAVGDVIPDYGGKNETFEVLRIKPPTALVYGSRRGRTDLTWSISLLAEPGGRTRVCLRLRLAPVKHRRLAETAGELLDVVTVAGMAAGLRERLN